MTAVDAAEMNRLRWRCRRGMRELDVILDRFLMEDHPHLDAVARAAFDRLLKVNDPDLYDWILGRGTPEDTDFCALVLKLQAHRPVR
jgi:antitoxin CptB